MARRAFLHLLRRKAMGSTTGEILSATVSSELTAFANVIPRSAAALGGNTGRGGPQKHFRLL